MGAMTLCQRNRSSSWAGLIRDKHALFSDIMNPPGGDRIKRTPRSGCWANRKMKQNIDTKRRELVLAVVNTPSAPMPVELREVGEPEPAADEAIVEVRAFSVNRGELALLDIRPEGWRPGQDIAGVVVQA